MIENSGLIIKTLTSPQLVDSKEVEATQNISCGTAMSRKLWSG
jgi:hypothetical protein